MSDLTIDQEQHAELCCKQSWKCKSFRFPSPLPPWGEELQVCPECGGPTEIVRLLELRALWVPRELPATDMPTTGWEVV